MAVLEYWHIKVIYPCEHPFLRPVRPDAQIHWATVDNEAVIIEKNRYCPHCTSQQDEREQERLSRRAIEP